MSEQERKIRKAIEMERHRQLGVALHRGVKSVLKKFLAGAAIIGAAVICAGFYDGDQVRVETVYTVQPGIRSGAYRRRICRKIQAAAATSWSSKKVSRSSILG